MARAFVKSMEAAEEKAAGRWQADLRAHCPNVDQYVAFEAAVSDDLAAAATQAELKRQGAGLQLILSELSKQQRAAS